MTKELYFDYLNSEHWQHVKALYKRDYCELCGGNENLQLHHLSYVYYYEQEKHVATLCDRCHRATHYDEYGNKLESQNPFVKLTVWKIRANPECVEALFLRSRLQ